MAGWLYSPALTQYLEMREEGRGALVRWVHPQPSPSLSPSVDDVQVSCYRTLCSIYSLGTTKNTYVEK